MSILESHRKMLVDFLDEKKPELLDEWHAGVFINEIDPHRKKVRSNAFQMFAILTNSIREHASEDELKALAIKVAAERVEANANIGDFVYNLNLGRSIIVRCILQSEIPMKDLHAIVNHINCQFDQFSYHAVSHYTNLKNEELQNKTIYINENHKDKLAILGQMSSSFVHEFRNPLTSIMGFNKLMKKEYPDMKYLDIIEHELNQLNFRITQFLHTSKAEINNDQMERILVKNLLDDIQQLSYPSIADSEVNVTGDLQTGMILHTQKEELKQVLLNLFINSIEALKQRERPRNLLVSAFDEGEYSVISISNNGPQIPPENIKTIFEPFYTTKELGTGIGLYVCKKLIEKQGGYISCDSNEKLTTFKVVLPKVKA
ncbi:ATP-binding protein [Metabacillus sp. GX 13764]|uniref:histidine kinase N-terminal domain-containing protein n=1 Tax=Metabacillus kandeliae TaxID=2900151 RepID=UPI001E5AE920|nr:histidine kinase N-terminal domain-containing protein [Metabacillus kandeliae]MCD7035019.1 ATP-binding protein [Metabacillus kandeliae]